MLRNLLKAVSRNLSETLIQIISKDSMKPFLNADLSLLDRQTPSQLAQITPSADAGLTTRLRDQNQRTSLGERQRRQTDTTLGTNSTPTVNTY